MWERDIAEDIDNAENHLNQANSSEDKVKANLHLEFSKAYSLIATAKLAYERNMRG